MFNFTELTADKYTAISLATKSDNQEILDFYGRIAMDTESLQLSYERSPDFFTFMHEQGDSPVVFLFRNNDASLGGMSSLCIRNCLVHGRPAAISYAGDLRTSPKISRRARIHWHRCYTEIVNNYQEFKEIGCPNYLFTVIIDGNKDAIRTFLKPNANPVYRKLLDFNSVNIIGQLSRPLCNLRNKREVNRSGYTFRWAEESDLSALKSFLHRENQAKTLGQNFTGQGDGELERRLERWNNFSINSFLLVCQDDTIVACMAPWSNGSSRRIVVRKAPTALRFIGTILPFLGQRAIKEGHELKVLYLTSFEIDSAKTEAERTRLLGLMIDFLFLSGMCKAFNLVTYLENCNSPFTAALDGKGYIATRKKAAIYQVLSAAEFQEQRFLQVNENELVGFELATA
jgi:hypothetical protein